eukprot:SAG31_NODE_48097_length_199_cov_29.220000_1_plen_41_part_10
MVVAGFAGKQLAVESIDLVKADAAFHLLHAGGGGGRWPRLR